MILNQLISINNKCPVCLKELIKNNFNIPECKSPHYIAYSDFIVIRTPKYELDIHQHSNEFYVYSHKSLFRKKTLDQSDLLHFDFTRPDLDNQLDLLLFYT